MSHESRRSPSPADVRPFVAVLAGLRPAARRAAHDAFSFADHDQLAQLLAAMCDDLDRGATPAEICAALDDACKMPAKCRECGRPVSR